MVCITVLAAVCAVAVGLQADVPMHQNYWWASGIVSFTWILILLAGIQAIVQRGRTRDVWAAFTMACAGYLLLASSSSHGPGLLTNVPIALISQRLEVGGKFSGTGALRNIITAAYGIGMQSGANPNIHAFFTICHCIFSVLFAVPVAWLAGRIHDRRLNRRHTEPPGG